MNILVAPDKFKGTLSAEQVCQAIREGLTAAADNVHVTCIPMADGGEGTARILITLSGGKLLTVDVEDPVGRLVTAEYGLSADGREAFMEMAVASGLQLLQKEERNPAYTSTVGTGQLIKAALDRGVSRIVIGIGGSATNEAGIGMAHALGAKFIDRDDRVLKPIGANLSLIESIDLSGLDPRIGKTEFVVLCDVTNPLLGPEGSTFVFSPQKGADDQTRLMLEEGMTQFASAIRKQFGAELNFPGAGAAGGLGAGAKFFLKASLTAGVDFMIRHTSLETILANCDLVISGEGKTDVQSMSGKVISGIGKLCLKYGKPFWVVCGKNELTEEQASRVGITHAIGLVNSGISEVEAMSRTHERVSQLVRGEIEKLKS